MMALVRSVIAASMASGSIFSVAGSRSERRVVGQARQVDDGVHALHELGVVGDVDDIGLDELEVRVAEKQGHGLISEIEPVETQDFVAFVHEPPR